MSPMRERPSVISSKDFAGGREKNLSERDIINGQTDADLGKAAPVQRETGKKAVECEWGKAKKM